MNRSSSLSSASRWLRRRAAEGIYQPAGSAISSSKNQQQPTNDSTEILTIHLQKGDSSRMILQSLPVAILQIENSMSSSNNSPPPDSLRDSFTQNLEACKKSRQNFKVEADYQEFVSKSFVQYLSLLGRILASPSASAIWVKSVASFSMSLKAAFGGTNVNINNKNDSDSDGTLLFMKLAKRSSPLWVNRWIQICQQEELVLSPSSIDVMTKKQESNINTTTSANLQRELQQRAKNNAFNNAESRQRRQLLLDCCEQVSTSLLPFCNREMLEHLQSSVLSAIEKERQKLVQEEKGVIAVMEQQLLLPSSKNGDDEKSGKNDNWNLALRTFLVNRDAFSSSSSPSSSSLRNNAADNFVKQSAGRAAIYCFEKIVVAACEKNNHKKNNSNDDKNNNMTNEKYLFRVGADSSTSPAAEFSLSSFLPQVAPQIISNNNMKNAKNKSNNNGIFQQQIISDFDSSFRSWSVQNSLVPSLLVYEYCRIASSCSSSSSTVPKLDPVSATTPMSENLIRLISRTVHVHQRLGLESSSAIDNNNYENKKNSVTIESTLVQFLAKFLTPFVGFHSNNNNNNTVGMNSSPPLSSAGRSERNKNINNELQQGESDTSAGNVLHQMLPTLSAISSLLVVVVFSTSSSINNSNQETLKNAWAIISNILKGNFSSDEKSDSCALSILDKLLSLSAKSSNINNNHVNNSVEGYLQHLPLIIDTFTVCLLASAIHLNVTLEEIEKSHEYFSNNLFNSHYGSFLFSRAQQLADAIGKNKNNIPTSIGDNNNNNNATLKNVSRHIDSLNRFLGFTNFATEIAIQKFLAHDSTNSQENEDMSIDEFLHHHSKLLIDNETTLDRIVSSKNLYPTWKSIWKFEQQNQRPKISNHRNEKEEDSNKVLKSLLRVSMWREAISIAKPFQVSSLCERILLDSSSSSTSSTSTKWELAVGLLSEISSRNLRLKPFALMTVLRALDNPSAPEEMSVNLAIQLGGGESKSSDSSTTEEVEERSNKETDVVNLLVSVTRAVLRQKHEETQLSASSSSGTKSTNDQKETENNPNRQLAAASVDPLLRARVFAISNLLSVQSTSTSMKRKQASSLRSAMLLCAESGDWQSAFFLISSASEKMPEFRLPPDVVWKVTQALENHGQRARVDLLKDFVASKDVSDWLHSDDENLLNETSVPSFSYSSSYSSKNQDDRNGIDSDQCSGVNSSSSSSSSSSPVIDPTISNTSNDTNANFALLADFVNIRCNAIHRAASLGRWKVAVSLFANVITAATHQTKKSKNDQILLESTVIRTPMGRALASLIKVCALRRHWQDALLAMKSFDSSFVASPSSSSSAVRSIDNYCQQQSNNNLSYIPTSQVSSVLIRCLSVYGRWHEATSLFSKSVVPDYFYQIESRGAVRGNRDANNFNANNDDLKKKQKHLATLFTYLTRACRISAAWSSALRLHNSASTILLPFNSNNDNNNNNNNNNNNVSVSLTSFSSVSEVVGACSAGGFPLTKIQMWLNLSKSSLFLVATSLKTATSSSSNSNDNDDEVNEETGSNNHKTSSSSVLEAVVRSPEISMIDLAVFFALLNAQSYYSVNNINKQKTTLQQSHSNTNNHLFGNASLAWIRSLQLLNACWFNHQNENNNINSEISSSSFSSSHAFFEAAREPECVTSVIDTCARNGKWIEAFRVYSMQKMLLIPVTSYAVYVLLVSLLEQQQQQVETNTVNNVDGNSSISSSKWMMACELVKDLMKLKRSSASASTTTTIQPIITEKFVQVLCHDGKWKEGLNLANKFSSKVTTSSSSFVSSSMAFLLNNDRVLDVLVKYATENSQVVLQAALRSGSFPVSPFHALGRKVEAAIRDLLFFSATNNNNNQEIQADERSFLLLPINTMSKCLKMRDVSEDVLCAARLRGLRVVDDRASSGLSSHGNIFSFGENYSENNSNHNKNNNNLAIVTSENISYWISVCQKHLSDQSTDVSPVQAVDFAFANLLLAGMAMMETKKLDISGERDDDVRKRYIAACEDLLRYSMLFGIPTKKELLDDWPLKLTEILSTTTKKVPEQESTSKVALLSDVVEKLKSQVMIPLAEEMP